MDVLRRVLLQNYTRTITAYGREVIRRREKEPEGDGLPPGHARIASPYDTDARWGVKREEFWLGYKLHVTETCDDAPPCTAARRRPGTPSGTPASRRGRGEDRDHGKGCAHLVFPNLITHVATTDATVTDNQMTSAIHDDLTGKNLAPGRHYLDSGYLSAALVVSALVTWGIALIGPLLADTSAQARAGHGYARADFTIDYDTKTATCPQGKTSVSWTPCAQRGKDAIVATFSADDCGPCPARSQCTISSRNAGSSPYCPATWPKPRQPPAPRKPRSGSRLTMLAAPASKAPCTRPPATGRGAPATAACRKPASTTCTWPARSTCYGCTPTGPAPSTGSEPATWHASNSASPHEPELTTRVAQARRRVSGIFLATGK